MSTRLLYKPDTSTVKIDGATFNFFQIRPYPDEYLRLGSPAQVDGGDLFPVDYDVRGEWLVVAWDSLPVRADITPSRANKDTVSVMLAPGTRLDGIKFDRIRIYYPTLVMTAGAPNNATLTNPANPFAAVRFYFGTGRCPITQPENRSQIMHARSTVHLNTSAMYLERFWVYEGMRINASVSVIKSLAAGENSAIAPWFNWVTNQFASTIQGTAPDMVDHRDVTGAALGDVAWCIARWRDVIVPRGVVQLILGAQEQRTAATNPMFGMAIDPVCVTFS